MLFYSFKSPETSLNIQNSGTNFCSLKIFNYPQLPQVFLYLMSECWLLFRDPKLDYNFWKSWNPFWLPSPVENTNINRCNWATAW